MRVITSIENMQEINDELCGLYSRPAHLPSLR